MDDDGSWSLEDGEVVCHQLGYEIPSMFYSITPIILCTDSIFESYYLPNVWQGYSFSQQNTLLLECNIILLVYII